MKVYLSYLERFIREIQNIDEKEPEKYIIKINNSISSFSKLSRMSYEKATILIGNELGNIREIIRDLKVKAERIAENPDLKRKQKIGDIKDKLNLIEKLKKLNEDIENRINGRKAMQKDTEEQKKQVESELEKIKQSQEYKNSEKAREEKEKELEKLKQKAYSIKEQVDLKLLMNLFHSEEKKKNLIQQYQDNFLKALEEDKKLEIQEMIKTAKPELSINLQEIKDKKRELENKIPSTIEKELKNKEQEITKLSEESQILAKEIKENEKKKLKLEEKSEQLLNEIKQRAASLGFEIKQ